MRKLLIMLMLLFFTSLSYATDLPINQLKLPPGYSIEIFANLPTGARQLAVGAKGTVFVGTKGNSVYAIIKNNGQTRVATIATGLNGPNGVAFFNGALYVSEINRILRYDDIENRIDNPPAPVVVKGDLPADTWHGFRYISFGPDNKLYIGIGAPCNVCETNPPFGTVSRMNADGSQFETYARGVRDSLGFDWDPSTQKMWFTDNGRDEMGDNLPPDKLNYAPTPNIHFGFPYHHGHGVPDPVFGSKFPESDFTMPALELPAHVAALGMKFYKGTMFPGKANAKAIFIAEHGSWNRSSKVGYLVQLVWVNNGNVISNEPFITGWLQGQNPWGRPVDVIPWQDGSLLISDDFANVVYRVTYQGTGGGRTVIPVTVTTNHSNWIQTVYVCNKTANPIPLKDIEINFTYPVQMPTTIWGDPWVNWKTASQQGNQVMLVGGTATTPDLPSDPYCMWPLTINFSASPDTAEPTGPWVFKAKV